MSWGFILFCGVWGLVCGALFPPPLSYFMLSVPVIVYFRNRNRSKERSK
jgi:hypothetical protein